MELRLVLVVDLLRCTPGAGAEDGCVVANAFAIVVSAVVSCAEDCSCCCVI